MKKAESVSWSKLDIPKEIITKEEETQDNSKGAENQVQIGNTQGYYSQAGRRTLWRLKSAENQVQSWTAQEDYIWDSIKSYY